jgi:hypothetical protein
VAEVGCDDDDADDDSRPLTELLELSVELTADDGEDEEEVDWPVSAVEEVMLDWALDDDSLDDSEELVGLTELETEVELEVDEFGTDDVELLEPTDDDDDADDEALEEEEELTIELLRPLFELLDDDSEELVGGLELVTVATLEVDDEDSDELLDDSLEDTGLPVELLLPLLLLVVLEEVGEVDELLLLLTLSEVLDNWLEDDEEVVELAVELVEAVGLLDSVVWEVVDDWLEDSKELEELLTISVELLELLDSRAELVTELETEIIDDSLEDNKELEEESLVNEELVAISVELLEVLDWIAELVTELDDSLDEPEELESVVVPVLEEPVLEELV